MSHLITKRQFTHKWPRPKKIGQENARILGGLNGRRNPGQTRSNTIHKPIDWLLIGSRVRGIRSVTGVNPESFRGERFNLRHPGSSVSLGSSGAPGASLCPRRSNVWKLTSDTVGLSNPNESVQHEYEHVAKDRAGGCFGFCRFVLSARLRHVSRIRVFSKLLGDYVALRSVGFGMLVLLFRIRSLKYHASDIGGRAICGP